MSQLTNTLTTYMIINLYVDRQSTLYLPSATLSAGAIIRNVLAYQYGGSSPEEVARARMIFTPTKTWAIAQMKGLTRDIKTPISGDLALHCDEETWNFANAKGLIHQLFSYTTEASKTFVLVGSPSCRLVQDPENDDRYLAIDIAVKGEVREVLDSEDKFRKRIVSMIPGRDLYLLRLSCNVE